MRTDDWKKIAEELNKDFSRIKRFNREFIGAEAEFLKTDIVEKFYTGRPGLNRRTSRAADGWQNKVISTDNTTIARIFNDVPYADHSKERTIRAVDGGYLAIPLAPALTKAGDARFKGPRSAGVPKLTLIPMRKKNGFLMVDASKKRGKKNPVWFLLLDKVTIPARTAGLLPFVQKQAKEISNNYGIELGKELGIIK